MKALLPVLSQDAGSQIVTIPDGDRASTLRNQGAKGAHQQTPTNTNIPSIVVMFSVYLYKRAASQGPQYLWCLTLQMETKKQQNKTRGKRKRA